MELVKMLPVEEFMELNAELKRSDLDTLKHWIKKQAHLPTLSENELALFLHSNYYQLEPTKRAIDKYFSVRTHVPELFTNRDPLGSKELRAMMKVTCYVTLSGSTPQGYKVLLIKVTDLDPSHYIITDALKLLSMVMELWLYTGSNGAGPGNIIILDMAGLVFGHVARLNPMVMKKFLHYLQEALPIRLKAVHLINTVPLSEILFNIVRPFIKKELMDVISFHSDLKSLSKYIAIDILPNEYGGKAGPWNDLWEVDIENMVQHRSWFQSEDTRKANEAARPEKEKSVRNFFGFEGSFKKLNID